MEIKHNVPYVVIGLLFVIGLMCVGAVYGAALQFGPEQIAEGLGIHAEIEERVEHLKAMNDIEEGIAKGQAQTVIDEGQAIHTARAQVWRVGGMVAVVLVAVWGGFRAYHIIVETTAQAGERRAAAGLREVQAEKEKDNPAFTPAGLFTRTSVVDGETCVSSDLTGEIVPVRDGERMRDFRQAHLAAVMAVVAAKRDVLIARAQRGAKQDDVVLIGDGL